MITIVCPIAAMARMAANGSMALMPELETLPGAMIQLSTKTPMVVYQTGDRGMNHARGRELAVSIIVIVRTSPSENASWSRTRPRGS